MKKHFILVFPFPSLIPLSFISVSWHRFPNKLLALTFLPQGLLPGESNITQPLSFKLMLLDILRKTNIKISANMFKEFTNNPKSIQIFQFKEPFLLQVQDSWALTSIFESIPLRLFSYVDKLTSPHGPYSFVGEEAPSS